MITYDKALHCIQRHAKLLDSVDIDINDALGRICAEDIICRTAVPPFRNSAMDGFAVHSLLLTKASANNPITLNVVGSTFAGDKPSIGDADSWEIMTGAPVPDGYDAVVRIEDVTILETSNTGQPQRIAINITAQPKQNIRNAGEDFTENDLALSAGTLIQPEHMMVLATLGISQIKVRHKPTITVISTGKELVDDPHQALKPGEIRNSNTPYLLSALTLLGANTTNLGSIPDDIEQFEYCLQQQLNNNINIIISTGAVSMGRHDFVPECLRKLGAEILFHKVAIRPGKPILFALFPNGTYYFGLPGNPISTAVGLRFFVYPLIRSMQNLPAEKSISAKLTGDKIKKSEFRFLQKAYAYCDSKGQYHVDIIPGQESFKVHPLLKANCWAILPEGIANFSANSIIEIIPMQPLMQIQSQESAISHLTNGRHQ